MSRAYRVTVSGSVNRVVHVEDGVCTSLELLPILPREETAGLLAQELEERGFAREGDVARRTEADGVRVEIELTTGKVEVKAEASARVAVTRSRTEQIYEEVLERGRETAQAKVQDEADAEAAEAEREAQREVTKKLERRLGDLRKELDAVTTRVTAEALKTKARSLGAIEEMTEDAETGELTIKVRL